MLLLFLFLIPTLTLAALQADPGPVLGGEDTFGITFAPVYTVLNGRSSELVLQNEGNEGDYLSKLTWDLNSVQMIGGQISLNLQNLLFFNFAMVTALDAGNAEMNDYDWLYTKYPDADRTVWTNWSESDIFLRSSYQLDYNTTVRLFRTYTRSYDILAGFKMIHWSWTDSITDINYPYESADYTHLIGKNGIDYEVYYRIPYLGASYRWIRGPVQAGATLLYSWMVNVDDHDYHIQRNLHFYDYYKNGQYFSFSVLAKFSCTDTLSLTLSYDWEEVFEIGGDSIIVTEYSNGSSISYDPGSVAVSYYASSLSLALEVCF